LIICLSQPAQSQEIPIQDEVGLLYSSQMQFGPGGTLLVTIGIMDGQKKVSISSASGLDLYFGVSIEGQMTKKTITSKPKEIWSFEVAEATDAEVRYWCGVESLRFNQKEKLDGLIKRWQDRGEKVQVFEAGSVFGIQGHVIDNRTYILGIRSYDSEESAAQGVEDVFNQYGTKSFVHPHLAKRPSGTVKILDSKGLVVDQAIELVRVDSHGEEPIKIQQVEHGKGYKWHGYEDRNYSGSILITIGRDGSLVVVNRVDVERLLKGLVPAEIFPDAPMEALKSQAVVARGEVLAKVGTRHFLDPYLLCATTHCQVYAGVDVEQTRAGQAVESTRGEFLFAGPKLVDSVYSASCGGHTENNDVVWSDPPSSILRGKPDMPADLTESWLPLSNKLETWLSGTPKAYCQMSTFNKKGIFRWKKEITSQKMDELVAKTKPIGRIVSIQVLERGVSGRVKVIRIVGTEGELVVQREWPVRQLLGNLKSGMFTVSVETDEDQMPLRFIFVGGGWGHGVGMCQIGAIGMAEHGFTYKQILSHYYSGAKVYRLYGKH
jgi:SpoIID/LytB domain protein